jgi:beta-lactamase superfamily II metal-dependent hydrolase
VIFTLEALQAFYGDSLLLHVDDKLCLIDGGPFRTWQTSLHPRLEELRDGAAKLRIDLAMVSHIDGDHIQGLTDLAGAMVELADDQQPQPYEIRDLWHNAFDDVLGNRAAELPATTSPVVASVGQGRELRDQAIRLGWPRNQPFGGKLAIAPKEVPFGAATLTVVAPDPDALDDLGKRWDQWLAHHPADVQAAAYDDHSVFNLSSIVVLAEAGGKRMLLCGDARGDKVLSGLEGAGKLAAGGTLALDLLKLPHHGSIRNVDDDFFARLPARHYVISANGRDGNPESATLEAIAASRQDRDFVVHFTNHDGINDIAKRLDDFTAAHPDVKIAFRQDPALALRIDLGDPLP